jgi:hypothetical protein
MRAVAVRTVSAMTCIAAIHLHPNRSGRGRLVVSVDLEARDGGRWHAIGGGATLSDAIGFARESAPDGRYWRVVRVTDLYGE